MKTKHKRQWYTFNVEKKQRQENDINKFCEITEWNITISLGSTLIAN